MIVECPACATRYDVPAGAIGPAGRKLKCAACGHGWHVDAVNAADPLPADRPPANSSPAEAPSPTIAQADPAGGHPVRDDPPEAMAAPPPPIASLPIASLPIASLPVSPPQSPPAPAAVPPAQPREASPFDYEPPFEPRARGGGHWLLWLLAVVALLAIVVALVVAYDPGGIGKRVGLARAGGASPVVITLTLRPTRRAMDSGNEMLAVAGRVSNPTDIAQRVPDIRAELRDAQGRTVYGWTIGAPIGRLAPGGSADFNSAEIDVPQAARTVRLRQAPTSRG